MDVVVTPQMMADVLRRKMPPSVAISGGTIEEQIFTFVNGEVGDYINQLDSLENLSPFPPISMDFRQAIAADATINSEVVAGSDAVMWVISAAGASRPVVGSLYTLTLNPQGTGSVPQGTLKMYHYSTVPNFGVPANLNASLLFTRDINFVPAGGSGQAQVMDIFPVVPNQRLSYSTVTNVLTASASGAGANAIPVALTTGATLIQSILFRIGSVNLSTQARITVNFNTAGLSAANAIHQRMAAISGSIK